MCEIIDHLRQHAIESIMLADNDMDEGSAQRLLEVHLEPQHFAMPIHDTAIEARLKLFCIGRDDLARASDFLLFEKTRTITGIARVLARTHINRTGVAYVTRRAQWPAQSPRVVELFDFVSTEADLREWLDYQPMLDAWLKLAERNGNSDVGDDRRPTARRPRARATPSAAGR